MLLARYARCAAIIIKEMNIHVLHCLEALREFENTNF